MAGYNRFGDFDLSRKLHEAAQDANFDKPTELQQQVIPAALDGLDVVFEARSGMGKSACFAIPFLQHWLRDRTRKGMVITSSHKAVQQLGKVMSRLCPTLKARVLRFTTRDDYFHPELLARAPIVVLESGVVERFMRREKEYVSAVRSLGLDEFDTLMGKEDQLGEVISQLPSDRQTLICVNDLTEQVIERSRWYCDSTRLERIKLARPEAHWKPDEVALQYVVVDEKDRFDHLGELVSQWSDRVVLVLTGSDRVSEHIVDRLNSAKLPGYLLAYSEPLDAKQSIVGQVTAAGGGILVACEAAMNGLTVERLDCLVSWDLPETLDDYWRRIDRFAHHRPFTATLFVDERRLGAVNVLERRLGRRMLRVERSSESNPVEQSDDGNDVVDVPAAGSNRDCPNVRVGQRFRMPVFADSKDLGGLTPDGVAKNLGSKFVPARKRR